MNYADFGLGTWHPKGGMIQIVSAMVSLKKNSAFDFIQMRQLVRLLQKQDCKWHSCWILSTSRNIIVSGADYHHTERLLQASLRGYSESYWKKKVFAPSSLLFYMGIDKN